MNKLPGYMAALTACDISIVPMIKGEWGEIFFEEDVIHISRNISLDKQLRALLHECLHWRWPNRTERQIEELETTKWAALKPHEMRVLLDRLYPEA